VEDIHFRRGHASAEDLGWKGAAAAISDVAAMGGAPVCCVTSLACPSEIEVGYIEDFYRGIANVAGRFGAAVVGGDTSASPGPLALDVTVIGTATGNRYLRRKGTQAGDLAVVTGTPGLAGAGFHALENGFDAPNLIAAHQRPRARVPEGQWLCGQSSVHAMIDVSDGLVQDLGHLALAAGLGLRMDPDSLPIHSDLADYAREHDKSAAEFVMHGGEDYELAFTLSPAQHERLLDDFHHEFRTRLTVVGEFTAGWLGVRVGEETVVPLGYDHFSRPRHLADKA
jgi:thiamine-monophosphate kinase